MLIRVAIFVYFIISLFLLIFFAIWCFSIAKVDMCNGGGSSKFVSNFKLNVGCFGKDLRKDNTFTISLKQPSHPDLSWQGCEIALNDARIVCDQH